MYIKLICRSRKIMDTDFETFYHKVPPLHGNQTVSVQLRIHYSSATEVDLNSACFPLWITEVLTWFTVVTMVHLLNQPHVVKELLHLVLLGDFGWRIFARLPRQKKAEVCRILTLAGQVVLPSENSNITVRGHCMISLLSLIMVLNEVKAKMRSLHSLTNTGRA